MPQTTTDQPCTFCREPVPAARVAIGKTHCTGSRCVAQWRRNRIHDTGLRLHLMPKVGQVWVLAGDTAMSGRSSGR